MIIRGIVHQLFILKYFYFVRYNFADLFFREKLIVIFTYAVGYNMLAAYNLQSIFSTFSFYNDKSPKVISVVLAIMFGAIVLGGAKRLPDVTKALVPFMGVIYANAAATADVSHPVKQGLVQAAIHSTLGNFGPIFIAVSMFFFAFTTLIGNYSYCEGCLAFVLKRNLKRYEELIFRCIAIALIYVGAVAKADLVWNMADMAQGFMVITNMPAILILGGIAVRCLSDYKKQKSAGLDPSFIASNIGVNGETDFWK